MRVLIVGEGELAHKIGEGAADAGASVEYAGEYRGGFDLTFLDASLASEKIFGSVALFHAKGLFDGKNSERAIAKLSNARIVNQIFLDKKGLLKNKLDEIDFERARAFGERTVRNLTGVRPHQSSEKTRIRGYKK